MIQQTKGNNVLLDHRKEQYLATKPEYAAAIRKERFTSWKEHCILNTITNQWSGIYRILAGRDKRSAPQTTLIQKDGTLTTNLQETIHHMLQIVTTEVNQENNKEMQKHTRELTQEDMDTDHDKEYTVQEVKNLVMNW